MFHLSQRKSGILPDSKDCNVCHKLLPPGQNLKVDFDPKLLADMGITGKTILSRWKGRISAGAFRHEGGEHPNLSCTACHNIALMNTLDPLTLRVPVKSCGGAEGCHITATADDGGALNFEIEQKKASAGFVCVKCHITFGKEVVPDGTRRRFRRLRPKRSDRVNAGSDQTGFTGGPRVLRRSLTFRATVLMFLSAVFTMVFATLSSRANEPTSFAPFPEPQERDYSKFKHDNSNHSRLPCLLCHRRETNAARPLYRAATATCLVRDVTRSNSPPAHPGQSARSVTRTRKQES